MTCLFFKAGTMPDRSSGARQAAALLSSLGLVFFVSLIGASGQSARANESRRYPAPAPARPVPQSNPGARFMGGMGAIQPGVRGPGIQGAGVAAGGGYFTGRYSGGGAYPGNGAYRSGYPGGNYTGGGGYPGNGAYRGGYPGGNYTGGGGYAGSSAYRGGYPNVNYPAGGASPGNGTTHAGYPAGGVRPGSGGYPGRGSYAGGEGQAGAGQRTGRALPGRPQENTERPGRTGSAPLQAAASRANQSGRPFVTQPKAAALTQKPARQAVNGTPHRVSVADASHGQTSLSLAKAGAASNGSHDRGRLALDQKSGSGGDNKRDLRSDSSAGVQGAAGKPEAQSSHIPAPATQMTHAMTAARLPDRITAAQVPDGHRLTDYPGADGDPIAERATLAGHAHDFHTRDLVGFTVAEHATWARGAWNNEWHYGRRGWWWHVGDVWYPYPAPIYPYPNVVEPPVVFSSYIADYGSGPSQSLAAGPSPVVPPKLASLGSPLIGDDALSIARLPSAKQVATHCSDPDGDYPDVRHCAQPWSTH
jgi:hypothetical protein